MEGGRAKTPAAEREFFMQHVLAVEDLHVTFRHRDGHSYAVRGVDLVLDRGESLGIVGESGSGKSVTSLALMGLVQSPPGEVRAKRLLFDGRDLASMSGKELQAVRGRGIAMIFQEPMTSLDPVFTVGDQIAETIMLHFGLDRKRALRRAEDFLSRVEIPDPKRTLGSYPHQLSGGMRQRAMIAMAISCEPAVLIADEPTTALDVTIQAQVLDLIKNLSRDMGMSLVVITHDLGVIAETADRVTVMYGGKVMETAGVNELFGSPAHPYTRALLASIPRVDEAGGGRLLAIPGSSPSPRKPPSGCPFHPRCAQAMDRCRVEEPPMCEPGPGRRASCWRLA
jgi:oligopeptide/dipeptide ABC transporter ATP-binding protein